MRKGYWIAAAMTLAFVGFGLTAFQKTLTPYLTFDEARKSRGVVQVMPLRFCPKSHSRR